MKTTGSSPVLDTNCPDGVTVATTDLKSVVPKGRGGSSPPLGTNFNMFFNFFKKVVKIFSRFKNFDYIYFTIRK